MERQLESSLAAVWQQLGSCFAFPPSTIAAAEAAFGISFAANQQQASSSTVAAEAAATGLREGETKAEHAEYKT